jgi:hypothetical protein
MYSVMRISALADAASIDSTSTQSQAVNRFEIDVMTAPEMRTPERQVPPASAYWNPCATFARHCGRPRTAPEVFRERVTEGLQAV